MTALIDPLSLSPYMRYKLDPWNLIKEGRFLTKREDAADGHDTIQPIPAKPHVWHMVRFWERTHPWIRWCKGETITPAETAAIRNLFDGDMCWLDQPRPKNFSDKVWSLKKSRRMMATWVISALNVWYLSTEGNRTVGLGSKTERDSIWVINERYRWIFDNLSEECWDGRKPTCEWTELNGKFSIGSSVQGFQQTGSAWRQFTFKRAHLEEVGFWAEFDDVYAGLYPAIGGPIDMVSTPVEGSGYQVQFLNNQGVA